MDWIKKNTTLVVGIVVALVAIVGAGYYMNNKMVENADVSREFTALVQRRDGLLNKRPNHPGFEKVDNIKIANDDFERIRTFQSELIQGFRSTTPGEPTERGFKSSLADALEMINAEGDRSGLTISTNFNMSFTAQRISYKFASNSLEQLSIQLADLTAVAKILVDARVNSIEAFRRVAVSADDDDDNAVPEEYIKNFAISTNQDTKAVIYPYEVSFRCFSEELGDVLEGIATSPYSILVKTIGVEPANIRNIAPKLASAASMYEGLAPRPQTYKGPGSGGKTAPMTSRYGGRGGRGGRGANTGAMTSRYGGAGGGRPTPNQPSGAVPPGFAPPVQRVGPEVLLQPEPLKVTLGLATVHMPQPEAEVSAKN